VISSNELPVMALREGVVGLYTLIAIDRSLNSLAYEPIPSPGELDALEEANALTGANVTIAFFQPGSAPCAGQTAAACRGY
jgi:hypothetical protein